LTAYETFMRASLLLLLAALPLGLHAQSQGQQGQNGNGLVYALPRVAVAPGTGQGGVNGAQGAGGQGTVGGITAVTIPTRMADRQTLASQFFAAGGVNLVDTNALPSARGGGAGAAIASSAKASSPTTPAAPAAAAKTVSPASLGTADGLYALGLQRLNGDGVPADPKAARALLAAAAQKGSAQAKAKLAELDGSRRAAR
jgi:hypothetical protein